MKPRPPKTGVRRPASPNRFRRRAYLARMFEGREAAARGVAGEDLFLVAAAHCLMAGDYEAAIDFATALARRQQERRAASPTAVILDFQASRRGSS